MLYNVPLLLLLPQSKVHFTVVKLKKDKPILTKNDWGGINMDKQNLIIGLIVVLGVLFIGGGITAASIVEVPVPVTTSKNVCENVPIEEKYTCTKTVPTLEQTPLQYSVLNSWESTNSKGIFFVEYWYSLNVNIFNKDTVGGIFKVNYNINKAGGGSLSESQEKYIQPGAQQTIVAGPYKFAISSWSYQVTAPTKEAWVNKLVPDTCTRIVSKNECKIVQTTEVRHESLLDYLT